MPEDGRKILNDWWDSLSPEQKDYYAKDWDDKDQFWKNMPMPEKWDMYYKAVPPAPPKVKEYMPELEAPLPTVSVQNTVATPAPRKVLEVKPILPTPPPRMDAEQDDIGKELGNQIQRPKAMKKAPKPKLEPIPQTLPPEDVPDFNSMRMAQLRKYAKDKDIKTGGRKMDDIRKDLYKAYS